MSVDRSPVRAARHLLLASLIISAVAVAASADTPRPISKPTIETPDLGVSAPCTESGKFPVITFTKMSERLRGVTIETNDAIYSGDFVNISHHPSPETQQTTPLRRIGATAFSGIVDPYDGASQRAVIFEGLFERCP